MIVGTSIGSGEKQFDIERELGSGAMGTVYLANWPHKRKKVALKIVALGLLGNEGAMARFEREASILKQLRHPHIVKLEATGAIRKSPIIVMEFIDGEPLDRVLARRGRMSWEEVITYGKQLCSALQYAHEKGIIHRDLKPSNLMITHDGVLKLTDFGIAKDTDVTALTGQNSTIGTASYMSPEQCKGDKNLTFKSDLYSLGIVFFELLSGKKPFYAENTVDMFLKHVNEAPPRIGKLVEDLPSKMESLILQLMEKDKDNRPVDAAWIVRLLTEIDEDSFMRKSVGLDVATSRRSEKKRNFDGSQLDDSDKEAARALRGKKKKKKKAAPFFQRKSVKAAGLVLALAALIGLGYLAMKPPSPEKMGAEVEAATSTERKIETSTKYLEKYGNRPGDLTDTVAAVFRNAIVLKRNEQMTNRFAKNMSKPEDNDDPEAYGFAWKALEAEKAGALKDAETLWGKVKGRFPAEAELPYALKDDALAKARWGWLAEKRLTDIEKVGQLETSLLNKIVDTRKLELQFNDDPSTPEGLAIKGFRLKDFKDWEKAKRICWDQLASSTEKDPEKRQWYLLASKQRFSSPKASDDPLKARYDEIEKKLTEAANEASDPKNQNYEKKVRADLRRICRDVIDLYDDETDSAIVKEVKRAKDLMAKVPN